MAKTLTFPHQRDLESTLQRERERLRQSLAWLANAEHLLGESQADEGPLGGDQADVAGDMAEQTLDDRLERVERQRLDEVEDALQKIHGHGYGLCEGCGEPIEVSRLVVLPWAQQCVRCSLHTRGRHGRPDA
jgi:RNA polymerase-binding transcription factor DksA